MATDSRRTAAERRRRSRRTSGARPDSTRTASAASCATTGRVIVLDASALIGKPSTSTTHITRSPPRAPDGAGRRAVRRGHGHARRTHVGPAWSGRLAEGGAALGISSTSQSCHRSRPTRRGSSPHCCNRDSASACPTAACCSLLRRSAGASSPSTTGQLARGAIPGAGSPTMATVLAEHHPVQWRRCVRGQR